MRLLRDQKIQPDWWTKSFAGAVLGLSLAFALAALITMWGLQSEYRSLAPQLGMWSIPWIWLPLFFVAYFIPRGWQSIVIYLFFNIVAYTLVFWLRGIRREGTYRYSPTSQRVTYMGRNLREHSFVHLLFCRWAEYVSA